MVKRIFFSIFRVVTCVGLVALLALRISHAPASKTQLIFLGLVLLWFVPTLIWGGTRRKAGSSILRHNAVFTAVDGYMVMMVAAEVMVGAWSRPVLLLGAYVFLAGFSGGLLAGITAAFTAFFGLLNGWLLPAGHLQVETLLLGGGTALAAMAGGVAWRWSLPLLPGMTRLMAADHEQRDSSALPMADRIAAMEVRLHDITAEYDLSQKRIAELEAKQGLTPTADANAEAAEPARSAIVVPATDDPALKARLEQVAATLADSRAERAAFLSEKRKLVAELADLNKDFLTVQASAPAATAPATPTDGGTHANG